MNDMQKQRVIYLLRHPETEWNVEGRFQGRLDSNLTKSGKKDAARFVEEFTLSSIDFIYFAENERTCFLAEMIKKRYPDASLRRDTRLNERDGGEYEGKLYSKIYNGAVPPDHGTRFSQIPPGGESYEMLSVRVAAFLKDLKKEFTNGEVIICITSSGVIRNMIRLEHNISLKEMFEYKIPNLALFEL